MNWKGTMQRAAKALMVPIVVMPVAALFIAIGQFGPDFFTAAGNAIIVDFLPLLFAVGVVIGFTDSDGMAAFAAVAGHLVLTAVMSSVNPGITLASGEFQPNDMSVLGGIIVGAYTAALYWRFRNIRFPEFLGFFSGKRFIPIITALVSVVVGVLFGYLWPPLNRIILAAGDWVFSTQQLGAFVYGVLNRLLIPTGLHHILQSLLLHVFGSFTAGGQIVTGEMGRFFAGDPTAGAFSGGFFIIMIFAIPAAALAMVHESRSENRKKTAGIMLTAALTSIITGITEPVEFAFIFTAPLLFVVHSLLTGSALFFSYLLGIRHYGYALPLFFMNQHLSTNSWLIFPLGVVYALIYYFVFRFIIRKFNYFTPGREPATPEDKGGIELKGNLASIAKKTIAALGGLTNLKVVDACLTRLRVQVYEPEKIIVKALKKLPAAGTNILGGGNVQIVFGGDSDLIKDSIRQQLKQATILELLAPLDGEVIPFEQFPDPVFAQGLLGVGIGFMPSGDTLVAPAAGEIVQVFPGGHALVMKTPEGLELLLHIGLDTVELEGEGFKELCKPGQQVRTGDTMAKFAPEIIKAAGKELHSALVVTNKDCIISSTSLKKGKVTRGDAIYIVQIRDSSGS
jgi:glucose-specific phosphotransferase system IIA component